MEGIQELLSGLVEQSRRVVHAGNILQQLKGFLVDQTGYELAYRLLLVGPVFDLLERLEDLGTVNTEDSLDKVIDVVGENAGHSRNANLQIQTKIQAVRRQLE